MLFVNSFLIWPAWAGKGTYPEHAAQTCKEITIILVERKEGESINDCNVKDRIKWMGDSDHIYISVFEANDLNNETIHDLISLCIQKYDEYEQKNEIRLSFYRESQKTKNHDNFLYLRPVQPFMEFKLRKGDEE